MPHDDPAVTTTGPARIGRYQVERRIGSGGMGIVYLARDPHIGRAVAIKLMQVVDGAQRSRFLQEMQFLGSLKHPHIVTIHDCGQHEARPYIVMELVEGMTLSEYIRGVPTPLPHRLQLVQQLCGALGYAHSLHIVHRDIKPANLMVDREGKLKVLDFGIARSDLAQATQDGHILGTLNYMSPEQLDGRAVDSRTDIFSTGLVMYELLTSRPAFPAATAGTVINAVLHEEPPPLATMRPELDDELQRIVDAAIQKDPARRYQTIGSLAADLTRVAGRLEQTAGAVVASDPFSGAPSAPHHAVSGKLAASSDAAASPFEETKQLARWGRGTWSSSDGRRYLFAIAGVVLAVGAAAILGGQYRRDMIRTWPGSSQSVAMAPPPAGTIPEPAMPARTPTAEPLAELVVPAGQDLRIQLQTDLSSATARISDPVEAMIVREVRVGAKVAIPAGTKLRGSVVIAEKGGEHNRRARIGVRFHTLMLADGTERGLSIDPIVAEGFGPPDLSMKPARGGATAVVGTPSPAKPVSASPGSDAASASVARGATAVVRLQAPVRLTPPGKSPQPRQ